MSTTTNKYYPAVRDRAVRELTIFSERFGMSVSLLQFDKDSCVGEIDDEEPIDTYDQFIAGGTKHP